MSYGDKMRLLLETTADDGTVTVDVIAETGELWHVENSDNTLNGLVAFIQSVIAAVRLRQYDMPDESDPQDVPIELAIANLRQFFPDAS
jgi:hypothetical protein